MACSYSDMPPMINISSIGGVVTSVSGDLSVVSRLWLINTGFEIE